MNLVDFTEHVVIRLHHTDAGGVVFYPRLFEIEQELFERWLEAGGLSLRQMLDGTLAPTPIVQCEGEYLIPLHVGDQLTAKLIGVEIGRSSYTLTWRFSIEEGVAMTSRTKRVAIDLSKGASVELPEELRRWLTDTQSRTATDA
jgi:1,4-dihydroxy-2-naphthoyl-CoA hydrolase